MAFLPQKGGGPFTIDPNASPDQLARKRELLAAMMPKFGNARYVGQGIGQLATGIAMGRARRQMDKIEGANRDKITDMFNGLFTGGGQPSVSAQSGGIVSAPLPVDPNSPQGIAGDAMAALGKSPDQVIRAGLLQRGLPEHVADGFIMNFRDESGLDPAINEKSPMVPGSRGGYGLAQWTGPRRVALENFAASSGRQVSDPNVQLDFLMTELQGPEAKAAQSIMGAPDASTAAQAIARDFLRPAQANLDRRLAEYGGTPPSVAQAGGNMDIKTLAEIAASPYASAGQRAVAGALLQQQMQAMDPAYALDLELKRKQVADYGKPKPVTPTDDMREYEYALSQGYQGTFQDFMLEMRKAGAANQSVTVGGESNTPPNDAELRKSLGKNEGELWGSYLEAGSVSAGTVQDMQLLDEIITMAPQGPISGRLAGAFPGVSSAADAFNSVVKRVAPTLRAPGSGSTSDIEYDGMLRSLPQLSARPEANRAIAAMMKAKADINVQRAEIVRQVQNDEITIRDARRAMSELDRRSIMTPELQSILSELGPVKESDAGAAPEGIEQDLWDALTPEERALWAN